MTAPARQRPADVARQVRAALAARQPVTVSVDGSRGWWVCDTTDRHVIVYQAGRAETVEWASVQLDGGPS